MQIIKNESQLNKYYRLWNDKISNGIPKNRTTHVSGKISFPCFVVSNISTNSNGFNIHDYFFTVENAKTLLNQNKLKKQTPKE